MPKIPVISGKEMLKYLLSYCCVLIRVKGSHHRLRNPKNNELGTLPVHNADLKIGTFTAVLRDLGIDLQDFIEFINM